MVMRVAVGAEQGAQDEAPVHRLHALHVRLSQEQRRQDVPRREAGRLRRYVGVNWLYGAGVLSPWGIGSERNGTESRATPTFQKCLCISTSLFFDSQHPTATEAWIVSGAFGAWRKGAI